MIRHAGLEDLTLTQDDRRWFPTHYSYENVETFHSGGCNDQYGLGFYGGQGRERVAFCLGRNRGGHPPGLQRLPGPEPCYTSLAAWQADYGGIDFSASLPGDLVAADLIAIARIEGNWTPTRTLPRSTWAAG